MTAPPSLPPVAKRVPHQRQVHGEVSDDPYAWLRNREDPDTLAYLEAENAWTTAQTAANESLREQLFQEIRSRIQETDLSVPVRKGPWWYYSRTEEGKQYSISCRRAAAGPERSYDESAPEQVLLDQNVEAEGHDFFSVGVFDVSPDHRLLAYGTDTTGGERFHLRFRDLETGLDLPDEIADVYYGSAWSRDSRHLFYVRPDDAMRPYQLWRHELGRPPVDDVVVHQEDDERFFLGIDLTKDERYLVLHLGSKVTDECWVLDADRPTERVHRRRAPPPGRRVRPRAPRGPLPDRHQRRRRRELQAGRGPGRRSGAGELARRHPAPGRREAERDRRVLRPPAAVRAGRRTAADPRPTPGRRGGPRHRPARGGGDGHRLVQSGVRHRRRPLRLPVDGDPVVGVRVRPRDPRAPSAQAAAGAGRLRRLPLRDRAAVGPGRRRGGGADLARLPPGPTPDGGGPALRLRLRLLRGVHGSLLLLGAPLAARPGLAVRHRPRAGRRRDGPALVPRRQVPAQEEHLHRLRRLRPPPVRRGLDVALAGWPSGAARPAVC